MALPKWLEEREEKGQVSADSMLMDLPEISLEEWQEAAAQYLRDAAEIVLFLRVRTSPQEGLLDQAEQQILEGRAQEAEPLVQRVLVTMSELTEPMHARTWARLAMTAGWLGDSMLRAKATNRSVELLETAGLSEVAEMVRKCHAISAQHGLRAGLCFSEGVVSLVDSLWVQREIGANPGDEQPPLVLRRASAVLRHSDSASA